MVALLEPQSSAEKAAAFWRNPSAWLRQQKLSRGFWVFFTAAFFFDAGFAVYFFLFNLYLLDYRFSDRSIGLIGGAVTLGTLVGTLPAGIIARRIGVKPLLILCFVSASVLNAARVLWVWEPAQIGLAFLAGLAMCMWGVCFLPAVARLTTEVNRTSGYSLIFSASLGTSILGGIVCGFLPQWLRAVGIVMQAADVKRLILLGACGIAMVGLLPVLKLQPLKQEPGNASGNISPTRVIQVRRLLLHPFLLRFLPLMALWSAVLAAFTPFGNVYLSRVLHVPIAQIGLIFSATQVVQFCMGLLAPVIFRLLGLVKGIAATQIIAAIALALLAKTAYPRLAMTLYLTFSAAQWMCAPGLYNLLMNETPDSERSPAAAMTLFCNALAGAAATAAAGILFTRFGYPPVLLGIAALATLIALLFWLFVLPSRHDVAGATVQFLKEDAR
jgi:predicted MFS family arabinose efflux permease